MPAFSHHHALVQADLQQKRKLAVLLCAMISLLLGCAWLLGGGLALMMSAAVVMIGICGITCIPTVAIMDMHRAVPVPRLGRLPHHPDIINTIRGLAERAGMRTPPALYRLPGAGINAMAAGRPDHAAIGLSSEAFDILAGRELRAILAHEISHVAAHDARLLALTCMISRLTQGTAEFALFSAMILMATTNTRLLSTGQILVFIVAVPAVALLHLALSRNQEFAADLGALRLTDDPIGLIAALERIEMLDEPPRRDPGPRWVVVLAGLLRSHPSPPQRISRLLEHLYQPPTNRTPPLSPVCASSSCDTRTPLAPAFANRPTPYKIIKSGTGTTLSLAAGLENCPTTVRRPGADGREG